MDEGRAGDGQEDERHPVPRQARVEAAPVRIEGLTSVIGGDGLRGEDRALVDAGR
jgi:hypothetical protein